MAYFPGRVSCSGDLISEVRDQYPDICLGRGPEFDSASWVEAGAMRTADDMSWDIVGCGKPARCASALLSDLRAVHLIG